MVKTFSPDCQSSTPNDPRTVQFIIIDEIHHVTFFLHNTDIINNFVGNLNHGDDLGFIFNRNTITGEKISDSGKSDEADERVTDIFTDMIANFARSGTLSAPTTNVQSNDSTWMSNIVPKFSDDTNSFVSITTAPKSMNNFR